MKNYQFDIDAVFYLTFERETANIWNNKIFGGMKSGDEIFIFIRAGYDCGRSK